MTAAAWRRLSGMVTGAAETADRIRGFLDGAGVVAVVEHGPEDPTRVGVTVAVDPDHRVAVVPDGGRDGEVVAGPPLPELAQMLAQTVDGEVAFDGGVTAGIPAEVADEDDGADADTDPFHPEIDVSAAFQPDRAVVLVKADPAELAALATAVGVPVVAAPYLDGQLVLVSEGAPLAVIDWPSAVQPALAVEQGAAYPSVAVVADGCIHRHTWDTAIAVVPEAGAEALAPFVDSTLGTGALVRGIMSLVPSAEPTGVRAAIEGTRAAPDRLVAALGMPVEASEFLRHDGGTPALPGARVHRPDGIIDEWARAVSDAVTDASTQMSESVRERGEHVRESVREHSEHVRDRAEQARVRAESAFDAAEAFTEDVVLPARRTWWTPAVAATELTLGVLALRRSTRSLRGGPPTTALDRGLGVVGSLLLVDAVVNATIFAVGRARRRSL
jgi:hypothetical protein